MCSSISIDVNCYNNSNKRRSTKEKKQSKLKTKSTMKTTAGATRAMMENAMGKDEKVKIIDENKENYSFNTKDMHQLSKKTDGKASLKSLAATNGYKALAGNEDEEETIEFEEEQDKVSTNDKQK
jgi:hypothetical protein